jgi:hypothetical protein
MPLPPQMVAGALALKTFALRVKRTVIIFCRVAGDEVVVAAATDGWRFALHSGRVKA